MASTKKKQRAEDDGYEKLLNAYRTVLDTPAGRDVLWDILGMAGIYSDAFTGNSHTFYNEGRRSIGLDLLTTVNDADIEAYAKMQLEQLKLEDNHG